jgi:tRNA pseudouridine38-40 synthase
VSAERRLAFRVEYDGTAYHGWQMQPGGLPTLAAALAAAAETVVGHPVVVDGASRTDAGVHARDQLAAATVRHPIRADGFVRALNSRLPGDVALRDAWEVPLDFAPRFATAGKLYAYRLYVDTLRRPLLDRFATRIQWPLDTARVAAAAAHLLGTHDFTSFAATDGSHQSAVRTLQSIELASEPHGVLALQFRGTAFLKHMVRNLAGTLIEVGRGQIAPDDVPRILAARDRRLAGPTAPARGLTLERVFLSEGDAQAGVEIEVERGRVADQVDEGRGDGE